MEYRTVFKCCLCGESYEGGRTGSEAVALQSAIRACLGIPSQSQAPTMTEVHSCRDGGLGVADFQGFRKIDEG